MQMSDHFTLHDNRKLFWYESGPEDGVPVIFCTGAGMSGSFAFGEELLQKVGVRIFSIDRPGLGSSDTHSEKNFSSWNKDIQEFIQKKNLKSPRALGFSQGSVYALSLAHAGIVKSTAIVSGQDDLHFPATHARLPDQVKAMIDLVASSPEIIRDEFSKHATPEFIWNIVMQSASRVDLAIYSEESFSNKYKQSLKEGFAQGPQGYIQDFINCASPWPFSVEDIQTPVHLWYGREDTSPVHSPDYGETLSKRIPHSTLHQERKEGGSLLWRMTDKILLSIVEDAFSG
jgi:pimeloyl-ACP methyl ester carboxylesterase